MSRTNRIESLNAAVAAAAERLRAAARRVAARSGPAMPGDVYSLVGLGEDDLAWLVVRAHPNRPDRRFVVPLDDNPLCGTPDVPLSDALFARCGKGTWLSGGLLPDERRIDVLDDAAALGRVRAGLATVESRQPLIRDPERRAADDDPSYRRWMRRVERARAKLERQAEAAGMVLPFRLFRAGPPPSSSASSSEAAPQLLAAKDGGLSQRLEEADRAADAELRHEEVALAAGTLRLVAGGHGLMLAWEGGDNPPPVLRTRGEGGKFHEVAWQKHGAAWVTTDLLPWLKERIVLRVGEETLTIRR